MIQKNYQQIIAQIPVHSNLIVVSKKQSIESIREIYQYSQREFGENQVQELIEKSAQLASLDINWHFIGHLQSNKINNLLSVKGLKSIHSIDSIKLLNKLLSKKIDTKIGLFVQVNTSNEVQKSGFTRYTDIEEAISLIKQSECFFFQGLMTIGRIRTDEFEEDAAKCFSKLVEFKTMIEKNFSKKCELSMGMSQDYQLAIEYKSDWLRIGSKIFK